MIVVMTIQDCRPAKTRALPHPAHFRRIPCLPSGTNLKFLELFNTGPACPGAIKTSQAAAQERFNNLTK